VRQQGLPGRRLAGTGWSRRHAFTQFPNIPSWTPRSRATSAIGLPVSINHLYGLSPELQAGFNML
jgi:hypothetical protein